MVPPPPAAFPKAAERSPNASRRCSPTPPAPARRPPPPPASRAETSAPLWPDWLDTIAPHFVNRGLWLQVFGMIRRLFYGLDRAAISRTHSSAGERSLHTGEVQGSIPCASTMFPPARFSSDQFSRQAIFR